MKLIKIGLRKKFKIESFHFLRTEVKRQEMKRERIPHSYKKIKNTSLRHLFDVLKDITPIVKDKKSICFNLFFANRNENIKSFMKQESRVYY